MKSHRAFTPDRFIIRAGGNCHRYICFVAGKIRSFTTHEKDFLFNLAALFGFLSQRLGRPASAIRFLTALVLSLLFMCPVAFALPSGWEVVSGDVTFDQQGSVLNVTSASQQAIVNYQSFNVAAGETVNFNFLLSGSSILNRVIGGGSSTIAGNLAGNGSVLLVNPAGINFASSANVNVGSMMASTLGIADHDYLSGNYVFRREGNAAGITNEGEMTAGPDGHVVLIGSAIRNDGTVTAPSVALAVGDQVTVQVGEDLSLKVTVDEVLKAKVDGYQAAIQNRGSLSASQSAELKAEVDAQLYQSVVNNAGLIQATGVSENNGRIILHGYSTGGDALVENTGTLQANGGVIRMDGNLVSQSGTLRVDAEDGTGGKALLSGDVIAQTGLINASGLEGGQVHLEGTLAYSSGNIQATGTRGQGGHVDVLGDIVVLGGNAHIDVSGQNGGGGMRIGGDYQGQGDIRTAQLTLVDAGVHLEADALQTGDGGRIIVWSDQQTDFAGRLSATGGAVSGNGGFAEVSGKETLNFNGDADLTAPHGDKGTLLLDPDNIIILAGGSAMPDPVQWLDANSISGVSDGQLVSGWSDLSGNGWNATSAGINQPTFQTGYLNGMPVLLFDGNDYLQSSAPLNSRTSDFTFIIMGYSSGANGLHDTFIGSENFRFQDQGTAFSGGTSVGHPVAGAPQVLSLVMGGSTATIYRDGTLRATSTPNRGATDPVNFRFGQDGLSLIGAADPLDNGSYMGDVLIFDSALSAADRQLIEHGLAAKYNLSVSGGTSTLTEAYLEALSQKSNVVLQANDHITFNALSDGVLNLGGTASLTLRADADGNGTGSITMHTGDTIRTEGGHIDLSAASMTLGHLDTRGALGNRSGGDVILNATGNVSVGNIRAANVSIQQGAVQFRNGSTWHAQGDITVAAAGSIQSAGTPIHLSSNDIHLAGSINAGSGSVTLLPSNSNPIVLGGAGNDGLTTTYDLDQDELGRITASDLIIGDATTTGNITLAGNLDISGINGAAGIYNLALATTGSFNANGNTIHLGRDAVYFDGANDYIGLGNTGLPTGNSPYALVAWIRPNSFGSRGIVGFGQWGSTNQTNALRLNGVGFRHYWWSNDLDTGAPSLSDGNWHHVVAQFDGVTRSIWLDGVMIASNTPVGHNAVAINARIGSTNNGEYFQGLIDEVQIYNQALTPAEIAQNYNNGIGISLSGNLPGLAGGWGLNEGSGLIAGDVSSNSNQGTLINGPVWVHAKNLTITAHQDLTTANIYGDGANITLNYSNTYSLNGTVTGLANGSVTITDLTPSAALTSLPTVEPLLNPPPSTNIQVNTNQPQAPDTRYQTTSSTISGNPGETLSSANQAVQLDDGSVELILNPQAITDLSLIPAGHVEGSAISLQPAVLKKAKALSNEGRNLELQPDANAVRILDGDGFTVLAELPVGEQPTDYAISLDQQRAFVLNAGDQSLTIIHLGELKVVTTLPLGIAPENVELSPDGKRIRLYDGNGLLMMEVDAASYQPIPIPSSGNKLDASSQARMAQSRALTSSLNRLVEAYLGH